MFVYIILKRKECHNFCNVNCVCSSKELTQTGCQAVSCLLAEDSHDHVQYKTEGLYIYTYICREIYIYKWLAVLVSTF